MMVRELVPGGGLLLHQNVAPLGRVLACVRWEGARSRGRTSGAYAHSAHVHAGPRKARLVLRRRWPHLLLSSQHVLLLLLQHFRLLLARYPCCHHSCLKKHRLECHLY